jgi:hypothetical protein
MTIAELNRQQEYDDSHGQKKEEELRKAVQDF